MRFQVPQFIEVEDKIFGPLTFKQFIYVAGGIGVTVVLFTFLPKFLAIIIASPIVLLAMALAFYKVNEKPFIYTVETFVKYYLTNKLYIWKKEDKIPESRSANQESSKKIEQVQVPKLSESKLKELTWSLDIKENSNPVTRDSNSLTDN
ncbi:MAG: PrgI family protein [Candidatus Zambryskibacteria bacterium]|nr:PrgI family protein [Candidatus Zambryskibacteria bacterium]